MIILGIDPGYERLGIALIEKPSNGHETCIYSECFRTSAKDSFPKRLFDVGTKIQEIITQYNPQHLAIEEIYFAKNTKTAIKVAEVRGSIITLCILAGLEIFEYHPNAIKLAMTGYGGATKKDILHMIPRLIQLPPGVKKLDDEIDALAITLTHSASYKI